MRISTFELSLYQTLFLERNHETASSDICIRIPRIDIIVIVICCYLGYFQALFFIVVACMLTYIIWADNNVFVVLLKNSGT